MLPYFITIRGRRFWFNTYEQAASAAQRIFERRGVVIGIEREAR